MTTQTTMPQERADRPTPSTLDRGLSGTERAWVWAGLLLVSLAVWTSVIFAAVLLFNGA